MLRLSPGLYCHVRSLGDGLVVIDWCVSAIQIAVCSVGLCLVGLVVFAVIRR